MRHVVFPHPDSLVSGKGSGSWLELPLLCCQDAGGLPESAIPIAAAWGMLYTAAHLMDAVEDHDELAELGPEITPALAVNLATGLYASSTHILTRMTNENRETGLVLETIRDFHQTILAMSGSQHQDLVSSTPSLQDWWSMAEGKSGSFFALGCRAGARLATTEPQRVDGYWRYGRHVGILIQIADDAKDLWGDAPPGPAGTSKIERSLPVLYAVSVLSPEEGASLKARIRAGPWTPNKAAAVRKQVEAAGAALYITTRIEQHFREATSALRDPVVSPQARQRLLELAEWTRSAGAA